MSTKCKASIIIPAFQRVYLLKWTLFSLAEQNISFPFETIVVNDGVPDQTEELCKKYKEQLNIKYIFSGQRNLSGELKWRIPGFAINIGAKQSSGNVLIIAGAEMFHLNSTIEKLTKPVLKDPSLLSIPEGWDDNSTFLDILNSHDGKYNLNSVKKYNKLEVKLPFLMGISRDKFFSIGGYDEDFTGIAYDDNDIVNRLLLSGCRYCQTNAKTIHLYHRGHKTYLNKKEEEQWLYNKKLYLERKGMIVRNKDREWGKI